MLSVSGLAKAYRAGTGVQQIFEGLSFRLQTAEVVALLGASGSGKTTLLNLLSGIDHPDAGQVQIDGTDIHALREPDRTLLRRRDIGFVFQFFNLIPTLTVGENIALPMELTGSAPAQIQPRVAQLLADVGLAHTADRYPETLSGGEQQRTAVARALSHRPKILLADEPTASLDRQSGREVVDRMKTLAKEHGTTILLVTHDNRILDIADRIVHLEDGRLSTFTDAVIANNRHMMQMLADNRHKQPIEEVVEQLDEPAFQDLLQDITDEAERFLEATALANNVAFRSMLERGLFAFTHKLAALLNADRASLFLVDGDELVLKVADKLDEMGEIRIPRGSGIAGAVAQSGEALRIDKALASIQRELKRKPHEEREAKKLAARKAPARKKAARKAPARKKTVKKAAPKTSVKKAAPKTSVKKAA